MEIRVLRYFFAVAQTGSVTRAAHMLHVTQPTLSRQLIDLEEELGQTLFFRSKQQMRLTPAGLLLRKRAGEIIELIEKTEAEFRAMGQQVCGDVYIGGGETESMRQIAAIAKDLQSDYPAVHYHLFSGNAEDVMERLDKGTLDFGLLIQPVDISRYAYIALPCTDIWGLVMRKDSPLATKTTITRDDLRTLPLIVSRQAMQRTSGQNEYMEWFGDTWNDLNVVATYNLIFNAALLVEEGLGYAITLDKLLNVTGSGNLCFRPLKPQLESRLNLVWKKDQIFSDAAQFFLERVRDEFAQNQRIQFLE